MSYIISFLMAFGFMLTWLRRSHSLCYCEKIVRCNLIWGAYGRHGENKSHPTHPTPTNPSERLTFEDDRATLTWKPKGFKFTRDDSDIGHPLNIRLWPCRPPLKKIRRYTSKKAMVDVVRLRTTRWYAESCFRGVRSYGIKQMKSYMLRAKPSPVSNGR